VAERDIEAAPAGRARIGSRPPHERRRARREPDGLRAEALAAVAPDRVVLDPQPLAQRERLGEVPRRHTHVVPVGPQQLDHRPHHEHVRAVRQVDPDTHGAANGNANSG